MSSQMFRLFWDIWLFDYLTFDYLAILGHPARQRQEPALLLIYQQVSNNPVSLPLNLSQVIFICLFIQCKLIVHTRLSVTIYISYTIKNHSKTTMLYFIHVINAQLWAFSFLKDNPVPLMVAENRPLALEHTQQSAELAHESWGFPLQEIRLWKNYHRIG